jgi:hypothetical protein
LKKTLKRLKNPPANRDGYLLRNGNRILVLVSGFHRRP